MRIMMVGILFFAGFCVARTQLVEDLLKEVAGQAVRSAVDRVVADDLDRALSKACVARNRESGFRFPGGAVLGFEVRSNQTRFDDEKLVAILKSQVKYWGCGLGIGPSFTDREEIRERNARDRDNEELRNPNPKGQVERPSYDIFVTARETSGEEVRGGDFGRWLRSCLRGSYYREMNFIEISIEIVDAKSQVAPSNGSFSVIGANLRHSRLEVEIGGVEVASETSSGSDQDLRDACKRLTKVLASPSNG
jgi:hypothetical protein